jgi:hypothetical protein
MAGDLIVLPPFSYKSQKREPNSYCKHESCTAGHYALVYNDGYIRHQYFPQFTYGILSLIVSLLQQLSGSRQKIQFL